MSPCMQVTDVLFERVRRGDACAFEAMYYELLPTVIAFVRSRTPRGAPVEDLVQEVFCRLWERRKCFEGRSSAKTYVLGIVVNVIHHYRQEGRSALVALERLDLPDPRIARCEDELERREILQFLSRARLALSKRQSAAIDLVYDEQMAPHEAAAALGCTETALRAGLKKARQKLRMYLLDNPSIRQPHRVGESSEDAR